ncbi:hypothetical protein TNCV_3129992 [Trichonephila clavipes]|nr:hypothetical protein TNCV_3129992 [Trichonephila clavipes]
MSRCGQGTMAPWARQLGCVLACYAPIGRRRRRQKDGKKRSEREKEEKRARKREGRIVGGRGEENPRVLLGDADQESETRMRKNALRTGRRQAVECLRGANNRVVMIANSWLVLSVMVRDLVPLKTRCVEGPIHVRSITARSPHVDMMWKMESGVQAQVSSLSLDRRSKGRGPSPVAFE